MAKTQRWHMRLADCRLYIIKHQYIEIDIMVEINMGGSDS